MAVRRAGGPVRADAKPLHQEVEAIVLPSAIRERRREVGLTQQQLADAVAVSRQTVIALESEDYAPSVFLALKVARSLRSTVEVLWGDAVR